MWVLARVMHVPPNDDALTQPGLSDRQVDRIVAAAAAASSAPTRGTSAAAVAAAAAAASPTTTSAPRVARKPLAEDTTCPICQDDMSVTERLVWCQDGCGNNIHDKCFRVYLQHAASKEGAVSCPLCRGVWRPEDGETAASGGGGGGVGATAAHRRCQQLRRHGTLLCTWERGVACAARHPCMARCMPARCAPPRHFKLARAATTRRRSCAPPPAAPARLTPPWRSAAHRVMRGGRRCTHQRVTPCRPPSPTYSSGSSPPLTTMPCWRLMLPTRRRHSPSASPAPPPPRLALRCRQVGGTLAPIAALRSSWQLPVVPVHRRHSRRCRDRRRCNRCSRWRCRAATLRTPPA